MGLPDSIWIPCPQCGTSLEYQSKAGECILADFTLKNAPTEMLIDIEGDKAWCSKCQKAYTVVNNPSFLRRFLNIHLIPEDSTP